MSSCDNPNNQNLDAGNVADGFKELFNDIHNGKIKNADDLTGVLAGSELMKRVGFVMNSIDVASALKADDPESAVLKALVKIKASAKGATYGFKAAGKIATKIPHPFGKKVLMVAGGIYGGVFGEEAVDKLFEGPCQPDPVNNLFTISSPTVNEKDGKAVFVVTNNSNHTMSIRLNLKNGSAELRQDYAELDPQYSIITLNAGESQDIPVAILNDEYKEDDETFMLEGVFDSTINNIEDFSDYFEGNNGYYTTSGICTIQDDDQVTLQISNPTIYEQTDNFIEFNINLSKPLEEDLVLKVKVKNGTATKGDDFVEVFDGFNGLEETQ